MKNMQALKKQTLLLLTLTFFCTQQVHSQEYENDLSTIQAYEDSSCMARWSPFIPLTGLILGAVFFGIANSSESCQDSYDSHHVPSRLHHSKSSHYTSKHNKRCCSSHSHH